MGCRQRGGGEYIISRRAIIRRVFDQSAKGLGVTAVLLMGAGWAGLYLILTSTLPTVGPRWMFFFTLALAVTGTALPFVWMLHKRFDGERPATGTVLLRQSLWIALFVSLITWLQINRVFTITLGLMLAVGFLVLEWFIRLLERSAWSPNQ